MFGFLRIRREFRSEAIFNYSDIVMASLSEVVVNLGNSTNMLRKQVTKKGLRRSKERRKCFLYFAPLPLLVLYGKGMANTAQLHDTTLWKSIFCSSARKCFILICRQIEFTETSTLGQVTQILKEYFLQDKVIL